jgi:hypothetical protein
MGVLHAQDINHLFRNGFGEACQFPQSPNNVCWPQLCDGSLDQLEQSLDGLGVISVHVFKAVGHLFEADFEVGFDLEFRTTTKYAEQQNT